MPQKNIQHRNSVQFSDLKMGFWNIGGLVSKNINKLEDDLFLAEIQQHDVICLAETHIGNDQKIAVEGYHCYTVCRPKSKNNRHFGGLAILTKKDIKQFVSILPNTHKDY